MIEPLSNYLRRYLNDPVELKAALKSPILLFEPLEPSDDEPSEYRFKTHSGVGGAPIDPSEPAVILVKKQASNAFKSRITVGRTTNNDLVLDDGSVSRFHAWFEEEEEHQWKVADAGSKNGTSLNGRKLTAKKLVLISKDAKLKFGDVNATFLLPDSFLSLLKEHAAR
ncbi:MAG: FHA domain-containing protein [Myxococcaceae bacterium]